MSYKTDEQLQVFKKIIQRYKRVLFLAEFELLKTFVSLFTSNIKNIPSWIQNTEKT